MIKIWFRFCLALSILILVPLFAVAGNEGANAGDDIGLQFESRYITALKDIADHHPDLQAKIAATPLLVEIENVQVIVVDDELYVEVAGQKQISAALNDPSKLLVLVNRFRWKLMEDLLIQRSLALHEILSLVSLESTGKYPISSVYYSRISVLK